VVYAQDLGVHSRDEAEAYLRKNFLHSDRIPLCVVAWSSADATASSSAGARVCGTVSLDVQDLAIRPHLGPWLVNTYVHPDYRGRSTTPLVSRVCVCVFACALTRDRGECGGQAS
jgi:hypothetical protein